MTMNMKQLKSEIYALMENKFEAEEMSYGVASDFSEAELDAFILTYMDYLYK